MTKIGIKQDKRIKCYKFNKIRALNMTKKKDKRSNYYT
jgi:hypothetical protein